MANKDFSEILNDTKELTLGQIFKLIPKLKYRTATAIVVFFISLISAAFGAGRFSHQKETAVMLESPFSMRIEVSGTPYDFNNLTLMRDPTMPKLEDDKVALSLREIQSAFDVLPVGQVIARVEQNKLTGIWRLIISKNDALVSEANAQAIPVFNWNGHENDFNFKEEFVDQDTVNRYYSDGCVLEYKVNKSRRSVPSSFRWIRSAH